MNITEAISEIQQPRSRYQLINFVIGQHDTPEMRFYQLMLELQDTNYKIGVAEIGLKKAAIEIEDLFNSSEHYTRDEIEHAQPEYWQKRLTRQTNLQIMSGGVQWAQLDSLRQIGLLDELVEAREIQVAESAKMELGT